MAGTRSKVDGLIQTVIPGWSEGPDPNLKIPDVQLYIWGSMLRIDTEGPLQ
jgi:hypothetical protein